MPEFDIVIFLRDFFLSYIWGKGLDHEISNIFGLYEEKENVITRAIQLEKQLPVFDGIEDELQKTKGMLVEMVSYGDVLEYFDYLKGKLRDPEWEWDGDPYAFEALMRDAEKYNNSLPVNSAKQIEFAQYAGGFKSIAESSDFVDLRNQAKHLMDQIQRKPLVYEEKDALYNAYPWLPQAIQNIPADSEDPTLSTILQAFNDIYTKIDTVVEELTATDTSLEEQISSLLGIETSLEGHESNLSTAVANIPNIIATMAPIQVYCSGGGSQDSSPTVEMGVDSVIEGVRSVVNGLSINLDGDKVGSYVDSYITRKTRSQLAGRGVFFG